MEGMRRLAGLHLALACAVAALIGISAPPQGSATPSFETLRPASNQDWGSRSTPADTRIEKGQLGGSTIKPGFQSAAALSPNSGWTVPGAATLLARSAAESLLPDRFAGPHSGRSPPRIA